MRFLIFWSFFKSCSLEYWQNRAFVGKTTETQELHVLIFPIISCIILYDSRKSGLSETDVRVGTYNSCLIENPKQTFYLKTKDWLLLGEKSNNYNSNL